MNGSSLRLIFAAALSCGLLAQDPGAPYEVSGAVYDARTNLPVDGATVMASGPSATSDSRGAFSARVDGMSPGIGLSVTKRGYVSAVVRNLRRGMNDLRITLKPSPQITGQLVDSETGEPLAGIPIRLSPPGYLRGASLVWMRNNAEKTGRDGRFAVPFDPSWGSLLFLSFPRLWAQEPGMLTDPSAEDQKAIDQDYEQLYWPGDGSPLNVASAASVDTGVLRLRKTNYYRAHVSFPASGCDRGAMYQASLFHPEGGIYPRPIALGPLRCGQNFVVRGLQPGSYRIEVTKPDAEELDRLWALMDFAIADKNVDLQAILAAGVDLQGRVVAADGARLPQGLTISLFEIDTSPAVHVAEVSPAVSTNLRFPNVVLGWKEVYVGGLPPTYATQVRYRGGALPGNILHWDGTGSLDVVVDDRGATITGRVMDGANPAGPALVCIVPWPKPPALREGEADFSKYVVRTDARGQFVRQGLNAGEYRAFAIPPEQGVERIFDPAALQHLLQQAERVTLDRGATQSVTLPLLDPAR